MVKSALPSTFSPAEVMRYKKAWAEPRALQSMINWYRAYKYQPVENFEKIRTPVLLLWGNQDAFLRSEMAEPSLHFCQHGQLSFLPEATHWLHHEQPEQVNEQIYSFVSG